MAEEFEGGKEDSPWKFVSFALVSEDNTEGKDIIKVWLYELLPFEEGEIKEIKVKEDQELLDMNGVKKKIEINRNAQIEARWYPNVDGRQTPPNVVEGETVEIYRYGHEDVYRWVSNGRQTELRRLEHVTYGFSDLKEKEGRVAFDGKSSYGYTFSTREKFVRFWTRMSDGESFEYQWLIDTKKNKIKFHDNIGNIFGLHSDTVDVYLRNSSNTYGRALQSEFIINASSRILLQSPLTQITNTLEVEGVLRVPTIHAGTIYANVVISSVSPSSSGISSVPVSRSSGVDFESEFDIGGSGDSFSGGSPASGSGGMQRRMMGVSEPTVDFDDMNRKDDEALERIATLESELQALKILVNSLK